MDIILHAKVGSGLVERKTLTGKRYFTLAVIARDKPTDDSEWINVTAFEPLASELPSDLAKGAPVYIAGNARLNRWVDKQGNQRVNLQVTAQELTVMGEPETGTKRHTANVRARHADAETVLGFDREGRS